MSHRICNDARLDVCCCLNRFEVDSIECLSWKSHTYLASQTHVLPVRLLDAAEIGGFHTSVSARDGNRRRSISFYGTPQEAFQLGLAAIKDSHLECLTLRDPIGERMSDGELERIAAVAATVKVTDLYLWCELRHLSAHSLHRLMFSFKRVAQLSMYRFNGHQLTDEHLHECGRRQISRLSVDTQVAEPLAVSDEGLLHYLFAPEHGMPKRRLTLPAFSASPQFVQKLVERAQKATNIGSIHLHVYHLSPKSQQLGGLHLTECEGITKYEERLETGVVAFTFNTMFRFYLGNIR